MSILLLLALSSLGEAFTLKNTDPRNPFAQATQPLGRDTRILGSYSAGCIAGAKALSLTSESFTVMKPSRRRYFGHPNLIALLERAAKEAPREKHFLIGDLSMPAGGPMPFGHAAHQVGLDADIWLTPEKLRAQLAVKDAEAYEMETVLDSSRKKVDPKRWHLNFSEKILWFASQPEVERIFVHGAIKKALCQSHGKHPSLKKVRPWYFHDSHFHVRLACPAGQTGCRPQAPPAGAECDASIDHWLTPAALKIQRALPKTPVSRTVELPEACRELVKNLGGTQ